MEDKPAPLKPHLTGGGVPDELMKRLNGANAKFHLCRQNLEAEMASNETDRDTRVERVADEIRAAEQELEAVNGEIKEHIKTATKIETQS